MIDTRVSVIVPTLDTRELTLSCVESVLGSRLQDGVALEVVVVDDGSTDGTTESLASRHPRVHVLRNVATEGFARAVNRGVAEAAGDVLVLLNSDAEVEPLSLACVLEALAADGRLGVVGATLSYPDGTAQWSAGPAPGRPKVGDWWIR